MFKSEKKFFDKVADIINDAIDNGDVFKANEIKSNILLSAIVVILELSIVICVFLNEIDIFHMPKVIPRAIFIISLCIDVPILILNKKTKGEPRWMRFALVWGNLLIVTLFVTLCGFIASMLFLLPVVLSVRYCDEKFTRRVFVATLIFCVVALMLNGAIGKIDLNVYVADRAHAFVDLDDPLVLIKMDKPSYFYYLFLYDCIPSLLCITLIGIACVRIAGNGKDMIMLEQEITQKTSRIDTELHLAIELQSNMLPKKYPAFPNHLNLDLHASNIPAKEMGGDFYDYLEIDDDHVGIIIADVSGKGIGAAFFMAIAKMVLDYTLKRNKNIAEVLHGVNNYLISNNESGLFVTCWVGVYEISTRTLRYCNAGHNYPVIIRKGSTPDFLKSKVGLVLSAMEDTKYETFETTLDVGDEIVLYTDGITEAQNVNEELYGDERLLKLISGIKDKDSSEQIDAIIQTLKDYMQGTEQFDDMTTLIMKVNE